LVFGELAGRLGADALCGRVGGAKCWVLLLEREELAIKLVVFSVRDGGSIEDVIFVRRLFEIPPERRGPGGELRVEARGLRFEGRW